MVLFSATPSSAVAAKHLLVDISAHGLGHLAQTASVLNELDCSTNGPIGGLRLTIRSTAPMETLRERIRHPFDAVRLSQDNGMIMWDALRVDKERTMEWYREFHLNYSDRKSDAARELETLQPDLVLSNIPYLCLDAAALVGVPTVALCTLNWADVFRSYCGNLPGAQSIHADMLSAYSKADTFLWPTPSMDMPDLEGIGRSVPPLAAVGAANRRRLRDVTDSPNGTRFALVGVGGYGIDGFPLDRWPRVEGVRWIFPDSVLDQSPTSAMRRRDFIPQSVVEGAGIRYIDILSTSDLVLTKTGYGTQVEAVVNRVPAICVSRHDWPEHGNLARWHEEHGEVEFIDWDEVGGDRFKNVVCRMLEERAWSKKIVKPDGAKEAARIMERSLQL